MKTINGFIPIKQVVRERPWTFTDRFCFFQKSPLVSKGFKAVPPYRGASDSVMGWTFVKFGIRLPQH